MNNTIRDKEQRNLGKGGGAVKTAFGSMMMMLTALYFAGPARAGNPVAEVCGQDPDPACLLEWAADPGIIDTIADDEMRFYALHKIARAQLDSGLNKPALDIAARALAAIPETGANIWGGAARNRVATILAEAGELEAALELVESQPSPNGNIAGRWHIVRGLANAERFEDALKWTQRLENGPDRAGARVSLMTMIARMRYKANDRTGALNTLAAALKTSDDVQDMYMRSHDKLNIALELVKIGEMEEARRLGLSLEVQTSLPHLFHKIAVAQAEGGDLADAVRTARDIQTPGQRVATLCKVARFIHDVGDTESARGLIAEALVAAHNTNSTDKYGVEARHSAISAIVRAYAHTGDLDTAISTMNDIADPGKRDQALSAIALAQAEAGRVEIALKSVDTIKSLEERADSLRRIALVLAENGDNSGARSIFANALETVEADIRPDDHYGPSEYRRHALRGIAKTQMKAGMIDDAIATARLIENVQFEADTIACVVGSLIKQGDLGRALALAVDAFSPYEKVAIVVCTASSIRQP
jgi:tetratricopeptide (TPR) repeat protein